MMPSSSREATEILSRQSRTRAGSPACRSAMAAMPMMAFMGVRMSWDMAERKLLLARLACSAAASESLSRRRTAFSSVMSLREMT